MLIIPSRLWTFGYDAHICKACLTLQFNAALAEHGAIGAVGEGLK